MNRSALVSIVIVNWNGIEDTKTCLENLKQQTYKSFEIVVVDNGSKDDSLKYLRKLKDIVLIENPRNLGFTGGHIAGYTASKGKYVLLLNNDAVMDKEYLKIAVQEMEEDLTIGALGGRAYLWDEANPLFDTGNHFYGYQNINPITAEGIFTQDDAGEAQQVNNVSGSCVLVRRSVIDKIGYLHNPFFAYYEESDLFARMKRAGFKVVYHPKLAIWHANAKTSSKKAPTFSLYMMMRNRYRFAVRNFDRWSLLRFLKFYTIMGFVSIIRSFTDKRQKGMHRAYAKAFFYNLAFGVKPFLERFSLNSQLGRSNYNDQIIIEQSPISIVIKINNLTDYKSAARIAGNLQGENEVVAVTSSLKLAKKIDSSHLRICLDRGYFNTHPENLAAVTSKNDWLVLSSETPDSETLSMLRSSIYELKKLKKSTAVICQRPQKNFKDVLSMQCGASFIISKSEFIDAGGLLKDFSMTVARRLIIGYSFLNSTLLQLNSRHTNKLAQADIKDGELTKLSFIIKGKLEEARALHRQNTPLDRLATRYYRLAQFINLIKWLFSSRISPRLKVARLKNLIFSAVALNRWGVATELKHMHNEVVKTRTMVDIVRMKEHEKSRLNYLTSHTQDTIVFIIVRDRLEIMKDLLRWLKRQGLNRIIFIDNDSRLPPLIDFLSKTEYQVLEMARNTRQSGLWDLGLIRILLPDDFYIVTDPDIVPVNNDKDTLKYLFDLHSRYPHHLKVGFGLKIDDLPDHYPLKKDVIKWESQFWKHEISAGIYEAGVDTTFALYKPYTYRYFIHPSLRTGEPFTARHLPWYEKANDLSDEEVFYRLRLDQNVNTWNKDHLPERYKIELSKQN